MSETFSHKSSAAVAIVYAKEYRSDAPAAVTLECISDPRRNHTDTFPFRVTVTSEMQPCCPLQGADSGYVSGDCPIHGKAFYLQRYATEPLTISAAEFAAEWEPLS